MKVITTPLAPYIRPSRRIAQSIRVGLVIDTPIVWGQVMVLKLLKDTNVRLSNGIRLLCPVRDEMTFLPGFLGHYRKMGVSKFLFIDNDSRDGTTDYLLAQPDCSVFHTSDSFRASNYAMLWINQIIEELEIKGWLIYVDVDEHLVYPDIENTDIQHFCEAVGRAGFDCVNAAMIDMYPQGSFLDLSFEPDQKVSDVMGWFDADYLFREWPSRPWDRRTNFVLQVLGGPRCRLLSGLDAEADRGGLFYTFANQVDRIVDRIPLALLPMLAKVAPREMPALQKRPINFVRPGFRYINSHTGTNVNVACDMTALLHYKFCGELKSRFEMKLAGNHYRRGLSYMQLEDAIMAWPRPSLLYSGSRHYRSSADLAAVGLIGPAASRVWNDPAIRSVRTSTSGPRAVKR
jgi:Glycosyl transferase family 2